MTGLSQCCDDAGIRGWQQEEAALAMTSLAHATKKVN